MTEVNRMSSDTPRTDAVWDRPETCSDDLGTALRQVETRFMDQRELSQQLERELAEAKRALTAETAMLDLVAKERDEAQDEAQYESKRADGAIAEMVELQRSLSNLQREHELTRDTLLTIDQGWSFAFTIATGCSGMGYATARDSLAPQHAARVKAVREYAEELRDIVEGCRRPVDYFAHNQKIKKYHDLVERIDAALAKNPNPSDPLTTGVSASGEARSVGLGPSGECAQERAESFEEAIARVLVGGESAVTLSEEARDKLAADLHEVLAPIMDRIRAERRQALAGLEAMTAARDYEKAAHKRTIDYYANAAPKKELQADPGNPASAMDSQHGVVGGRAIPEIGSDVPRASAPYTPEFNAFWDARCQDFGGGVRVKWAAWVAWQTARATPSQGTSDTARLDWLEKEMERELVCTRTAMFPKSLFRRNLPITREAIDEAMKEVNATGNNEP